MSSIDDLKDNNGHITTENVMRIIPYNEHFLFIDEVTHLEKGKIVATKKVPEDADYLKGHFVDFPIMPGALIVEGMGQAATLLARYNLKDHQKKDVLAYKIRDAKFFKPVFPGHEMRFEIEMRMMHEKGAIVDGKVFVGDEQTGEAFMMVAIVDRKKFREKSSSQ